MQNDCNTWANKKKNLMKCWLETVAHNCSKF